MTHIIIIIIIMPLLSLDLAVMVDEGLLADDLVPGRIHRPASSSKRHENVSTVM